MKKTVTNEKTEMKKYIVEAGIYKEIKLTL